MSNNTSSSCAPIILFVYTRLAETKATICALQNNFLATESDLFIYSDGPKQGNHAAVSAVREYIHSVSGFKSVTIFESETNKGLARSIISGVTDIISKYDRVIVLEDDIKTSRNFLEFMNQCLRFYQTMPKVFSISGFAYPLPSLQSSKYDAVFGLRAYPWGWATWKDRWNIVDWEVSDYYEFCSNAKQVRNFSRGGSDLPKMLKQQMNGSINSWMIRWVYAQFTHGLMDVFPKVSKTENIGFGDSATHTDCSEARYITNLDYSNTTIFTLNPVPSIDKIIQSEFQAFHSFTRRAYYKIYDLIKKILKSDRRHRGAKKMGN